MAFVSWRALGSSSPTHRTPMPGSIVELAENPAKAAQLGRDGRSAVIQGFSWEASCKKMLQLYETHLGVT